jgi:hypothetical protein
MGRGSRQADSHRAHGERNNELIRPAPTPSLLSSASSFVQASATSWWVGSNGYMMVGGIQRIDDGMVDGIQRIYDGVVDGIQVQKVTVCISQ